MQVTPAHLRTLCLLLAIAGCTSPLDFGSDTESKALTYSSYVANGGDAWFDPIGASDIYHRCFSTRDGYDAWWRFSIAESNLEQLIATIATDNEGPSDPEWAVKDEYPAVWQPDDSPPAWWSRDGGVNVKSIYWCYDAGEAERHHGWYFLYDTRSQMLYCWHWNHQWSFDECK